MWDENKLSTIYPGQMTSFNPAGAQTSHRDVMKLEPPFSVPEKTTLADSSRKRKAIVMEQQASESFSGLSESVRRNLREEFARLLLTGSDGQSKVGGHLRENGDGRTQEMFSNRNVQVVDPSNKQPHFGEFKFFNMNSSSTDTQIKDGNLQKAAIEKMPNLLSDRKNLAYDLACKIEAGIFQSYSGATDIYIEKAQTILLNLKDGVSLGLMSQQQMDKSEHAARFPSVGDGKSSQDFLKIGSSANSEWSSQNTHSNNIDVSNRVETRYGSVIVETSEAAKPSAFQSGHEDTYSEDRTLTDRLEVSGDNLEMHSKQDSTSAFQKPIDRKGGDDLSKNSLDLDGPSKLHAGKAVPSPREELWDGLLQLNTSTIVTTVAYFKSGEKAPKVDWYKTVEVKGKVRLEAFEKFIQELPRSRNRALMVISLRWKSGSSKNGLMGMKEVAKNYKEGERVGFAQLSPGIDLYVCPRSDTIITILAKYGFYKGMAIAEDDKDSLIGCVVWRRNRVISKSVSKQPEKKKVPSIEQPTDSPGSSSVSQTAETNSPVLYLKNPEVNYCTSLTQPLAYSSPLTSETKAAAVESSVMARESKNILSSKDQAEVGNSVRSSVPNQGSLVPDPSPVTTTGISTPRKPDSSSLRDTKGSSSEIETPTARIRDPRKPDLGFELSRPLVSEPSQILQKAQQGLSGSDDDDLPEFDFNAACGISPCPQSEVPLSCDKAQISDSHLTAAGIKDSCGPMRTAFPITRPVSVTNHQSLHPHPVSLPSLQLNTHQDMSQQAKKPGEQESKVSVLPNRVEKSVATGKQLSKLGNVKVATDAPNPAVNSCVPQKNIWDDDEDDMPEWCPPYLENQNQTATSAEAITRPPNPYFDTHNQSATSGAAVTRPPHAHLENLNQSATSVTPVTRPPNPHLENLNPSATSLTALTRPPNPYLENQYQSSTSSPAITRPPNPHLENRNPLVTRPPNPHLENRNPLVTRPPNPPASEAIRSGLPNAPSGPISGQPPLNPFGFHHGYPPRFPDQGPISNSFPATPPRPIGGHFEIRVTSSPFSYNPTPRPHLGILEPRPAIRPVNGRGWRFGNS